MEADHNPQWRKPAETAELFGTLRWAAPRATRKNWRPPTPGGLHL